MGFSSLNAVFVGKYFGQKNVGFGGLLEPVAIQRQLRSQIKKISFDLMMAKLFEFNKPSPLLFPHPGFDGTPQMMVGIKEALEDGRQRWLRAQSEFSFGIELEVKGSKKELMHSPYGQGDNGSSSAFHSRFPYKKGAAAGTQGCSWVGQEMEKGGMEELGYPEIWGLQHEGRRWKSTKPARVLIPPGNQDIDLNNPPQSQIFGIFRN